MASGIIPYVIKCLLNLLNILRDDIIVDLVKLEAYIDGDTHISSRMIGCVINRSMGGKHKNNITDTFGLHYKSIDQVINMFLHVVTISNHHDIFYRSITSYRRIKDEVNQ